MTYGERLGENPRKTPWRFVPSPADEAVLGSAERKTGSACDDEVILRATPHGALPLMGQQAYWWYSPNAPKMEDERARHHGIAMMIGTGRSRANSGPYAWRCGGRNKNIGRLIVLKRLQKPDTTKSTCNSSISGSMRGQNITCVDVMFRF